MATLLLGTTVGGFAAIHAGNIGAQSVNYANSAGSVAWTNVSGRPTALSQFTNDLGNYGNWITASALSGYATQSWVQSYYAPRAYVTDSYVDFYIYGDQNKYYPVTIHSWNGGYGMQRYSVSRGYSWSAPWDPIGTGTHQGGLTFTFEWSGDIAWGGNDKSIRVIQFGENYTNMVAGMQLANCEGVVVWLRGGGSGGAHYRLHGPGGLSQGYTINMSAWTSCAGVTYTIRDHSSDVVNSEINARYPIRNSGDNDIYVNNNIVATRAWVQSQNYLTSLPSHNHDSLYVPLGRTITINGVTQDLSDNRSFTISSSLPAHNHDDRYYTESESDGRYTRNLGFQAFVGSLNDLDGQYTVNLDGYGPINGYGGPDAAYNASLWGIGNRNRGAQIYIPYAYDQLYFRRGASDWSSWFRVLNTSADPYPSNMNQYVRTTDSPTFSSTISVTADGSSGYVASRIWLYSHDNYRGAGVYMSGTGSTWFSGTPYTNFDGVYMIARRTGANAPDAADPSYRLWQVNNGGSTYQTGDVSATSIHAYSATGRVVAGSWNFDGMLFDSSRSAVIARGNYPHFELWSDVSNSNHGGTLRFSGYDNGSSGAYKSWNIGAPGSNLYFLDIAYGGTSNPNPHAGIAGLGEANSYPGAFNMMRFHNNGNIGVGNFGEYGSEGNNPAYKLDVRGNGRYTQLLYLDAAESLNLYGIRGRFTNEYIHLYNKVGIGHPSGWGQGEGDTPNQGLSTYGGMNIAYGNGANSYINGYLRINKNWAGGDFGAEQLTIRGTYPSITLRSTQHNSKWLIHHASELQFYYGGTADDNNWANKFSIPTDGNIWMAWANANISTLLDAKQNASTAINTSNIGSQSVSYATNSGNSATTSQRQFDYIYTTSYLESAGAVYGTIFYDNDDRAYYLSPAGSSRLRNLYVGDSGDDWSDPGGWGTQVRFSNAPHVKFVLHARTPGIEAGMYVHTPGEVYIGSYTGHNVSMMWGGSRKMFITNSYVYTDVYLEAAGSMRAPIFYDSADTGFYLDPNDTSNLWRFTDATLNRHSLNSKQVNSPWSTRASQGALYQTGAMGWGQVDLNVIGSNWGSGFFDTWSSPANGPGSSGHYVGMQAFHYSNSDSSRFHGWQMACAQEANNRWFWRSAWDSPRAWVEMIHSGNIGSQSVNYASSAGNADTVDGYHASTSTIGNGIVVREGNGYILGNYINMSDNSVGSGVTGVIVKQGDNYYRTGTAGAIQSFLGLGSLAYSSATIPTNNNQLSNGAGYITSGSNVVGLYSSGWGNGNFTWYQTPGGLEPYGGSWASFLVSNHGDGSNYYNQTIIMPFWGPPQYSRREGGPNRGPYTFWSTENLDPYNLGSSLSVTGSITASGDIIAYSDARIKTNVITINNALEKVLLLRGVTYARTDSDDTKEKIGVIAQEVQKVLPQVVFEQSNGLLGVSYGNMVGLLIEAIKEQQKEIDELKAKLN
jgi:hypothetical protein